MKKIILSICVLLLAPVIAFAAMNGSSGGGSLSNIVEDTTPQLGGALDGQGYDIDNVGDVSAQSVTTSAADGARIFYIPRNTSLTPGAGLFGWYFVDRDWGDFNETGSPHVSMNGSPVGVITTNAFMFGDDCDEVNEERDICVDITRRAIVIWDDANNLQVVVGKKNKHYRFSVQDPENLNTHAVRSTKSVILPPIDDSFNAVVTKIVAHSDTDDYAFNIFKCASATDCGTANDVLLDLVTCSTNGTGTFYDSQTTISSATVTATYPLIFEHSSGAAETIMVDIYYYLNADVD